MFKHFKMGSRPLVKIKIDIEPAEHDKTHIFMDVGGIRKRITDSPIDLDIAMYTASQLQKDFKLPDESVMVSKKITDRLGLL